LRLLLDGAGLAGMAVSQVVALRGPGWPGSLTACRPMVGWLPNDVPAGRGLAVAWLKRGASAMEVFGIRRARHGLHRYQEEGCHGGSDDRG